VKKYLQIDMRAYMISLMKELTDRLKISKSRTNSNKQSSSFVFSRISSICVVLHFQLPKIGKKKHETFFSWRSKTMEQSSDA